MHFVKHTVRLQEIFRIALAGVSAAKIVLIGLLFAMLVGSHRTASKSAGIDFYQFWVGGHVAWAGQGGDLYSPSGRERLGRQYVDSAVLAGDRARITASQSRTVLATYSTPLLYATFGLFSTKDYSGDLSRYRYLELFAFVVASTAFARLFGVGWTAVLAALVCLIYRFQPLGSELRVGNVGCIQFLGLSIYALLQVCPYRRLGNLIGGTVLGLLFAFKPNLVFLAPPLLLEFYRRGHALEFFEQATGSLLGVGFAVIASSWLLGSFDCWLQFFDSLRLLPENLIQVDQGNIAPVALLQELGMAHAGIAVTFAATILLGVGVLVAWRSPPENTGSSCRYPPVSFASILALGCLLVVLLPELAWLHYFVLVVPAMFWTLAPPPEGETLPGRQILLATLVWCSISTNPFDLLGIDFSMRSFGVFFTLVVATLFLAIYSATLRDYRRHISGIPANPTAG